MKITSEYLARRDRRCPPPLQSGSMSETARTSRSRKLANSLRVAQAVTHRGLLLATAATALLGAMFPAGWLNDSVAFGGTQYSDTMSRTVASGWGASESGHSYLTLPAEGFHVDGSRGVIVQEPGQERNALVSAAPELSASYAMTFSVSQVPTGGGGVYIAQVFRRQADGDCYRVRVKTQPGGTSVLSIVGVDGTTSALTRLTSDVVLPFTVQAGERIRLRAEISGTSPVTVRARAWQAADTEPAAWNATGVDARASRITTDGAFGIWAYLSSTATNRVSTLVDDLSLAELSTGVPSIVRPAAANTGVPDNTALTPHNGNLIVTTPGSIIDKLDVRGFVDVRAPNVTIRRSIIRGGVAATDTGLINVTAEGASLALVDSTLKPASPSYRIDGIRGSNFTLLRVEITGTVDGVHIHGQYNDRNSGGQVRIEKSWLHDFVFYPSDPRHADGSHNDAIQIEGGSDIRITNNTLGGAKNAAVMIDQGYNDVRNVELVGNWANGGVCTFNIDNNPLPSLVGITITDNLFGRQSTAGCGIIISKSVQGLLANNLWEDTRTPTTIYRR